MGLCGQSYLEIFWFKLWLYSSCYGHRTLDGIGQTIYIPQSELQTINNIFLHFHAHTHIHIYMHTNMHTYIQLFKCSCRLIKLFTTMNTSSQDNKYWYTKKLNAKWKQIDIKKTLDNPTGYESENNVNLSSNVTGDDEVAIDHADENCLLKDQNKPPLLQLISNEMKRLKNLQNNSLLQIDQTSTPSVKMSIRSTRLKKLTFLENSWLHDILPERIRDTGRNVHSFFAKVFWLTSISLHYPGCWPLKLSRWVGMRLLRICGPEYTQ